MRCKYVEDDKIHVGLRVITIADKVELMVSGLFPRVEHKIHKIQGLSKARLGFYPRPR